MRTFLAIDVPSFPDPPTHAEGHLTLKFLGQIDPDRIPALSEKLRAALRVVPPFEFLIEGVGAFPTQHHPRVVWAGVTDGRELLVDLARRIEDATAEAGVPRDTRAFTPHLTLMRARGPRGTGKAHGILEKLKGRRFGTVRAREVVLFESELRPEGAVHRPVEHFPLGGSG